MTKDIADFTGREPTRDEIEALPGPVLLEFGATWCGHCQALQPQLTALLEEFPKVRYIWVEDGKGKPLGRSFGVKLWPNLVFLRDGKMARQLARPETAQVRIGLEEITRGA
jgi:thioredoxin 1